jgi:hypothetical protein
MTARVSPQQHSVMSRRTCVAVALIIFAGCGGGDEGPTFSRSEVRDAFSAEGINLSEVGRGELRSEQGFWILVFESPEEAQARANLYEGSGTLGQPEIAYKVANLVVYTAYRQLRGPVSERVEAALARLNET